MGTFHDNHPTGETHYIALNTFCMRFRICMDVTVVSASFLAKPDLGLL